MVVIGALLANHWFCGLRNIVRYDGDFVVRGLVISCFFGALLGVGTNRLQAFMLNVNKIIVLEASLASKCKVGF